MELIKKYIYEQVAAKKLTVNDAKEMLQEIQKHSEKEDGEIAVIGMACKFPNSDSALEFWDNLKNGVDCIREFPEKRRKDTDALLKDNEGKTENPYLKQGYLNEVDKFDAAFFNITPKEAKLMDPMQRLLLETVWEAIEDAGMGGEKIIGSKTGVFMGKAHLCEPTYKDFIKDLDPMAFTGLITSTLTGRLSYFLDLKEINAVVDTACSSGLVSVHLACQALKDKECEMAIAGGINLSLFPAKKNKIEMLESKSGVLRPFDKKADGTVWGEGVGVVVLKPLKKALAERDNIYAVIKGSACNSDGASNGMTAPNAEAQEELLVSAWKKARIDPGTITYIEAHGTGTELGDPIEVKGITNAFRRFTDKKQFCGIGSVKANIGHLVAASGMASLIKVILALKYKEIPKTINFDQANPYIKFADTPVFVNDGPAQWIKGDTPRRAGISSFGLSGINCHVVLEEAPEESRECSETAEDRNYFIALSAKSDTALVELAERYIGFIEADEGNLNIKDVVYTANSGRGHYSYRLAVIFKTLGELKEKLKRSVYLTSNKVKEENVYFGRHKVVPENKKTRESWEITESEKREFSGAVNKLIEDYLKVEDNSLQLLNKICELYVKGAGINWDKLYAGESCKRVSLPTYPFEKKRYWVDAGEIANEPEQSGRYFSIKWRQEELDGAEPDVKGTVLILKDAREKWNELADSYRAEGRKVIEVLIDSEFKKVDEFNYNIKNTQEDFDLLVRDIEWGDSPKIVHTPTAGGCKKLCGLDEIEAGMDTGFISLFYLARSILKNEFSCKFDIAVITEYANDVTGEEEAIKPENALVYGLCCVLEKEAQQITCRCIDTDKYSDSAIIRDLKVKGDKYHAAYRKGKRYVKELGEMDIRQYEASNIDIKPEGIYVITGGAGGLGLEAAKFLASKGKVKLALINRSRLPERDKWDETVNSLTDNKNIDKIKAIMEIEALRAKVVCYSADISNQDEVRAVINELQEKYGRINGIIHCAGVPGEKFIIEEDENSFKAVISPKVQGTWILDNVTGHLDLDFFILFSSVATLFPAPGQGAYAAANSYLDSYGAYRRKNGKKTLVVNWVVWKDIGMAAKSGFQSDTAFKPLIPEEAVKNLEEVMCTEIDSVLIGEINYESKMAGVLDKQPVRLSETIKNKIESSKPLQEASQKANRPKNAGTVRLKGKYSEEYSKIEKMIAQTFKDVLGFDEIDIHDSFFDIGADSISLSQIYTHLQKQFAGKVSLTDVFEYNTIYKLSQYISEKDNGSDKANDKAEKNVKEEISSIIDELEEGNLSIDEVIDNLNKI